MDGKESGYIVSLMHMAEKEGDAVVKGDFYLDADEHSNRLCDELIHNIQEKNPKAEIQKEMLELTMTSVFRQLAGDQFIIVAAMLLVLLVILLNITTITSLWLEGKKREIFVKKLSGGTASGIVGDLFFNYLGINLLAYTIGACVSVLFARQEWFGGLPTRFSCGSVVLSFLFCLSVGSVFGAVVIYRLLNKELAQILR